MRVCAVHLLPTAREHEPCISALGDFMFLRPRDDLQQLSQHIGDVIPQPAHTSQIKARSVERAMGASHSATGWTCKAAGDAAHLVRLPRLRRAVHRDLVGRGRPGQVFKSVPERVKIAYYPTTQLSSVIACGTVWVRNGASNVEFQRTASFEPDGGTKHGTINVCRFGRVRLRVHT